MNPDQQVVRPLRDGIGPLELDERTRISCGLRLSDKGNDLHVLSPGLCGALSFRELVASSP